MHSDRSDNDRSSKQRPLRRTLADKDENPNRIKKWLDETYKACIQGTRSAAHAFDEKNVRKSDLKDAEECDRKPIHSGHRRECGDTARQIYKSEKKVSINNCDHRI